MKSKSPQAMPSQNPAAAGQKTVRDHFRDGLLAALRADPEVVSATRSSSAFCQMVRGLVLDATRGKTGAIRLVLATIGDEPIELENKTETIRGSQGSSRPAPRWDWNEAGEWDPLEHAEAKTPPAPPPMTKPPTPEEEAAVEARAQAFLAMLEAEERAAGERAASADAEAPARMSDAASGNFSPGGAGNSGDSPPPTGTFVSAVEAPPQQQRSFTIRIAGREVETRP
ncbi:MAG TPA: hypothetical protein VGL35_11335 [Rhizomicrobium sp.]